MGRIFDAVIFDLDGVITKTALVHARSWKKIFDDYLRERAEKYGEKFEEFTYEKDYIQYVDGKPRYNGVKSFLKSRGIELPMGDPSDPPDKETICGIGNKKNEVFKAILKENGVEVYETTIDFIKELKANGIRVGVASSSKNCLPVLQAAGIEYLFETRVDGVVSAELGLKGKPDGDIFIKAAANLGALPYRSVVVEDAKSGVQAGRNGGFGLVVGVAREKNAAKLMRNGADVVVRDLTYMSVRWIEKWFLTKPKHFFTEWEKARSEYPLVRKKVQKNLPLMVSPYHFRTPQSSLETDKPHFFFVTYDGALTRPAEDPKEAVMDAQMRALLTEISSKHLVAIISGRNSEELRQLVGIEHVIYVGNHGFDIIGERFSMIQMRGFKTLPLIKKVTEKLKEKLSSYSCVLIEEKKINTAIHVLKCSAVETEKIKKAVEDAVSIYPSLKLVEGRNVFEILPNVAWGRGSAVAWLMKRRKLAWSKASVFYIGSDVTDEFALRMIRTRGTGIVVDPQAEISAAHFYLNGQKELKLFFKKVIEVS